MKKLLFFLLIFAVPLFAADTELQDIADEMTDIQSTDLFYVVDDPSGTPNSEKITALNIFDMIDTFAELDAITADETLVSEEGTPTLDALWTFALGLTITTGDPFTFGVVRWDNGSDKIDGEQIADNTIDVDSLDWGAFTDLGESGAVTWGNLGSGELADSSVVLADIASAAYAKDLVTTAPITGAADNIFVGADSDVTVAITMLKDIVTTAPLTGAENDVLPGADADLTLALDFTAAWTFTGNVIANGNLSVGNAATTAGVLTLLEDDDDGANFASFMVPALTANTVYTLPPDDGDNTEVLQTDGSGALTWVANAGGGMTSFQAEDGDGTEVSISNAEEWKFVEGAGIDINWTDVDPGSDADPFDLTFTVALGTDIAAAEMADADHGDVQWNGGDADVESMDLGDASTGTYYVGLFADDTGTSRPIYADAPLSYAQATGTLTAGEFSGGGGSLTGVDAATGDSATAFFDAGTIEHEWGGLQADVSGWTGLFGITGADTSVEVDTLAELLTAMGDVTAFITDDDMPAAGTDPDVDAAGEIGRDTDGANEANDVTLRMFEGSVQYSMASSLKSIQATIANPQDLDDAQRDCCPIWHNNTGMVFTITEIWAWSDTDDTSVNVEVVTATNWTTRNTIDALEIAADGTGVFTDTETTITDATIAHDEIITLDFDDTDDPGVVKINIVGWLNADIN